MLIIAERINASRKQIAQAIKAGDLARVRTVVQTNDKLVNLKDTAFGATPLHWAALKGQLEIASYLLEKGADADARNNAGETPLQVAERAKRTELVARLRTAAKPSNTGVSALIDAVRAGNLDRVRELIGSNPALVRAADNQFGATALHWAALRSEIQIVRFLLAQGADRQARNNDGETALQVAERAGKTEVVKVLKQ